MAEVKESIIEEEQRPEGAEGSTETNVHSEVSTEQKAPLAMPSSKFRNHCSDFYLQTLTLALPQKYAYF